MNIKRVIHRKSIIRAAFFCLTPPALYILMYGWYFWSNAGRSPDRYGVLTAMLQLHFSNQSVVPVRAQPHVILTKVEHPKKALHSYMRKIGWKYVDQAGATSSFQKGSKRRYVYHLAMTRYFELQTIRPEH